MFSLPCLYLCGSYPSTRQINRLLVVQFDRMGLTTPCAGFSRELGFTITHTIAVLSYIVLICLHIVIYLIPTHFRPHRLCLWCTNAHYLSRNLHNYLLNLQNLLHRYLFIVGLTTQLLIFTFILWDWPHNYKNLATFLVRQRTLVLIRFGYFVDVKNRILTLCYFTQITSLSGIITFLSLLNYAQNFCRHSFAF